MIDLHCHMLPAIDDGAKDLKNSLAMLDMAVDDGIEAIACTPHIYPGLYPNTHEGIAAALQAFKEEVLNRGYDIELGYGADIHMDVGLSGKLKTNELPTLFGSRYFLLEMPNQFPMNILEDNVFAVMRAGYVPVITHPERQSWSDLYYEQLAELVHHGAWIQITANSLTRRFGKSAQRRAERLLDDGLVAILASDAHNTTTRPPVLSGGYEVAKKWVGDEEARHMVYTRPKGIVNNTAPEHLPQVMALTVGDAPRKQGIFGKLKRFLSS